METRVAVISIIVKDKAMVEVLNGLLSEAGDYIIGRMGLPYAAKGINIITVAIDAPQNVISSLTGKIGRLKGISTKTAYSDVVSEG